MRVRSLPMLALGAILSLAACSPPAAAPTTGTAADEAQIRTLANAYATGFSSGDSKPIAAVMADDYQDVEPDGSHPKSAKEAIAGIEKQMASMPKDMKMTMTATTEYVRFLSAQAAVAGGTYSMTGGMPGMPTRGAWMGVAVKQDSTWKMVASLGADDITPMYEAAMKAMPKPKEK